MAEYSEAVKRGLDIARMMDEIDVAQVIQITPVVTSEEIDYAEAQLEQSPKAWRIKRGYNPPSAPWWKVFYKQEPFTVITRYR